MKNYKISILYLFLLCFCKTYASQFTGSTAFQVNGVIAANSVNQVIIYVKLDASATPTGTWGINGIGFTMLNSSNSMVRAVKLFYSTTSTFSNVTLLDSIANPTDTFQFQCNLSNLGIISRYLFLTYDIDSNTSCNSYIFDARVAPSSLIISGQGGGSYTPVDPNPAGNRNLPNPTLAPSVTILMDSTSNCLSDSVTFFASATNGGSNPQYKWYKNGTLITTDTSSIFSANGLTNSDVIFCKLLSSLPCITASPVSSNSITINFPQLPHLVTVVANGMLTAGNLIQFTASSNFGGSSPDYQWFKNSSPVGSNSSRFLDSTLIAGDQISCSITSNNTCVTPAVASSPVSVVAFPNLERNREVALLDLGPENQETNGSNLFSASHMLDVAGIPYTIVTDIFEAQNYSMVVGSSTVGSGVFSSDARIALRNYVRNNGILFTVRLKDPSLYSLFGISGFDTKTTRHLMNWNMSSADASLQWFDDSLEQTISLGDTSTPNVIETLGYTLSTASMLGSYDDGKTGVSKNAYGTGFAYNFGISLKEIIFRNQVNKDYDAEREYTNAFEPTTDDLFLFLRAIYTSHISNGIWKHTSPNNSKSSLIITHDIDALSSVNLMESFANYEDSIQAGSTYFMTVHYNNDLISAFYDSSVADLNLIRNKNRSIASHSIGHFVDMDDSLIVLTGSSGNTRANYTPLNNGGSTVGATIWGELEVSKNLLLSDCNANVRSFRPGYLLVHPKQMEIMDSLNYEFSSSYTAPDVLTNFPYFIHENKSFQSRLTSMLEIPIATSDVIRDFVLDSLNYPVLVNKWNGVYIRNHANNAPTVLLIHPTRSYKLAAQRSFINNLPNGVIFKSMEEFGDFWKARNNVSFTSSLTGNVLSIIISNTSLPLDSTISFIINNGQNLNSILVKDQSNNSIGFVQANWGTNSKIIYLKAENLIGIKDLESDKKDAEFGFTISASPNPFANKIEFNFTLTTNAQVELSLVNLNGIQSTLIIDEFLFAGNYKKTFDSSSLMGGLYVYRMTVNGKTRVNKMVLVR